MEEVKKATLSEKLVGSAQSLEERYRARRGDEARLPGNIRLMYSAAACLEAQEQEIESLKIQLQTVTRMLAQSASCDTCKDGPAKQCGVRSECGAERSLWSLKTG